MTFLNLSEYELPLEHLLVLLLFGGVCIVRKKIDNQPTTWKDLKDIMRQQFFPPYYRRELLPKFEQFKQGNNIIHAYYQEFKSYMHHCDIEESEDDTRNRFFRSLNHDIDARLVYYSLHY